MKLGKMYQEWMSMAREDNLSRADKMFREIDYQKYDNHPEHDLPLEPNMWSTQDCRRLYYEQKGILEDGRQGLEHIEFDLSRRNVICYAMVENRYTPAPLSMDELLAILEVCKERGWLDGTKI